MKESTSLFFTQAFTLLAFTLFTFGSLLYFSLSLINMLEQIMLMSNRVTFARGAYYMLGTGVSSGALLFIMLYERYTKKTPSTKATKIFTRTAIGGLLLAFLLPPIAEYLTENHLSQKGYQYCDVPSSSWPIYKDVIYTIDTETCIVLNEKEKKKFPSLYPKDDDSVIQHY